jgi:hypothetical protein
MGTEPTTDLLVLFQSISIGPALRPRSFASSPLMPIRRD